MLEKILNLLETATLTEGQIAEQLHINKEELQACISYLEHAGYIRSTTINPQSTGCSGGCSGCGHSTASGTCGSHVTCNSCNSCSSTTAPSGSSYKIWELTNS